MPQWECAAVGPDWAFAPMPPADTFKRMTRLAGSCAAEDRELLFTNACNNGSPVALKYTREGSVMVDGMNVYKYKHIRGGHAIVIREAHDVTFEIYADEVGADTVQIEVLTADGLAIYQEDFRKSDGQVRVKDILLEVQLGLVSANRLSKHGKLKFRLRNAKPANLNKVIVKRR